MPTLQQLPQVATISPADRLLVSQQEETSTVSLATVLETTQPKLTLASGALLGRVSALPGGPEPVQLGVGLAIRDGVLGLDTSQLAPVDSPEFIGAPRAPTPPSDDVSRAVATTEYVQAQLLDRTTVALGARLPEIDASDARVSVAGGVPRSLRARAADAFNVRDFGAKGDVVRLTTTATIGVGGTVLHVAGVSFHATDVGKFIVVSGAGLNGRPLATSIAGAVDATHVVLTAPALTPLVGMKCVISYGSNDVAAFTSAMAAAAGSGGKIVVPPGSYGVTSTITLPESGSVQFAGSGYGDTSVIALAELAGAVVSKGTTPHRNSQLVDLWIDANALAPYALDLQCAAGYSIERVILSNGTTAGLRIGDGVHDASEIHIASSRIDNDMAVFGIAGLLPAYNIIVNGAGNYLSGVNLANARVANLRDNGFGDNVYVASRASGHSGESGECEAQYGYWLNGSATMLGCEVDGVRAVTNTASPANVDGAGIRVDGPGVRIIGGRVQRLAGGAVGILLTADPSGNAPGSCYIAGNRVDIADASAAVVQQGVPQPTTIICDNPGAAFQQGTSGVVASGIRELIPSLSGLTIFEASYSDPQTFSIAEPLAADLAILLPMRPNVGARYRCVRTAASGGSGVVRVRPAGGSNDGSDDVAILPRAGLFADIEWDGRFWLLTSQGSLDGTRLALSGDLIVAGDTSLQAATATTPLPNDNSSRVSTTAFVKSQGFLTASRNLSDVSDPVAARVSLGLGSVALQSASAIAVTGGSLNGTAIGRDVPSTANFTMLSAAKLTLTGGAGVGEAAGYVTLQSANGPAAQFGATSGVSNYLTCNATSTAVTLSPGQSNSDLVLRGSGSGVARAPFGFAVNGGTLTANVVGISGGTIDGVTLGSTLGVGPIKGVAKAQFFEASWEAAQFGSAGGAGANDTLTLVNASNAHLALWSPNKSLGWGMNIDATTGNLRLLRTAGSGSITLGNTTPVVIGGDLSVSGGLTLGASGSRLGFYGASGGRRPTVIGSRGGNAAIASLLSALAGLGLLTDATTT